MDVLKCYMNTHKEIYGYDIEKHKAKVKVGNLHHLIDYDARYYCYLLCDIYATDLYESIFKGNIFDPKTGTKLRNFLEELGSQSTLVLLKTLLGRNPRKDAF